MARPLCFVLMPFGSKPDSTGALIDFDAVYRQLINPAIQESGLEPIRADEEMTGGVIHKAMYERLILCEYAVADLTTANANVFYELGVRHALRPYTTVQIYAERGRLPFDVSPLRTIPYRLTVDGAPAEVERARAMLIERLRAARVDAPDSPLFQLIDGLRPASIDREKTDVFREQVYYSAQMKDRLAEGRRRGVATLQKIQEDMEPIQDAEAGIVIDLFLSYRAVRAWELMIALVEKMSPPLARSVMVREQLALALNRFGKGEQAEHVLLDLLKERGPSSETYGILGRVYKDRWEAASKEGNAFLAGGILNQAIDAYVKGFESDWRDAYPGVNAVTLMELKDKPDSRRERLLPVVTYAVQRRIESGRPDYWDYATMLELAVLARDKEQAESAISSALAVLREVWEAETTARNLRLIREARERRGETIDWAKEIERALEKGAAS